MAAVGFLILLALDVPVLMLRGLVLSYLWLWFVVPLGVAPIGIAAAIGISILVAMIAKSASPKSDSDKSALELGFTALITSTLSSLLAWGLGAIVVQFA